MITNDQMQFLEGKSDDYRQGFDDGWKMEFWYHQNFCTRNQIKSTLIDDLKKVLNKKTTVSTVDLYELLERM